MARFLLIPEGLRDSLVQQLLARADAVETARGGAGTPNPRPSQPREHARSIQAAATIQLPELHTFRDSTRGDEYQSCGWDRDDALQNLVDHLGGNPGLVAEYGGVVFPGFHSTWRGRTA